MPATGKRLETTSVKFFRTTQEQLKFYIAFCKDHPQMQYAKNSKKLPKAVEEQWKELAAELNQMAGPKRTSQRWKETLTGWRSKLRSRAKKAQEDLSLGLEPIEGMPDKNYEDASFSYSTMAEDYESDVVYAPDVISPTNEANESTMPIEFTIKMENVDEQVEKDETTDRSASASSNSSTTSMTKRSPQDIYDAILKSIERRDQRDEELTEVVISLSKCISDLTNTVNRLITRETSKK